MAESKSQEKAGKSGKKRRVAWGITGSGDKIVETVEVMKRLRQEYLDRVNVSVYMSKAGAQVARYYKLSDELSSVFGKVSVEVDSNSPFLAGALQHGDFEFLLVAPATSNTVAKVSLGIADTLLSNASIMALKAFIPVYVMPSDYREGVTVTVLPNGQRMRLRIRREDVANVRRLANMEGVSLIEKPEDISQVFKKHFGTDKKT